MKSKSELIAELDKITASIQHLLPKEHIDTLHDIRHALVRAKREYQITKGLLALANFLEIIRHFLDK